jgi:SHO1 osmosensor
VGVLWFAIFMQLFLILGVLYTLASDSIAMHRFQISTFGAVAIVFAVIGVDQGIFTGVPALDAMAAGWLLLSIVNILWVLYFTSEEDSLALHIFNSMGTGGLSGPGRRRRGNRAQSVHNANNGYAANYSPGGGIGNHDIPYDTKVGSGIGSGGLGGGGPGLRSQNSFGGGSHLEAPAARSVGGGGSTTNVNAGGPGSIGGGDNIGANSPLMGSGAAGVGAGGTTGGSASGDGPTTDSYAYKAKALYACECHLRPTCL